MAEYQNDSTKLLPSYSSWDNRDSFGSSNSEPFQGDEGFYEEIEAPKFVDFTVPDNYCPDDRYWFCDRVGCDQKHEEEMDDEAIYKKFVLRAMAARSPNVVRIRKILEKDTSRKCPLSAPPKASKPRMTIISTFPKRVNEKVKVIRPLLKPRSTPVAKTKPVSAKYLTTPRIRKGTQDKNSFRSVRNPKPNGTEESKSRMVAKALVFHSPNKKAVKLKTSVELRTPVSKLCERINKLEISSQQKGYSEKSSMKLSSGREVLRRPEETLCSKNISNQESKSGKSIKSKINGGKSSHLPSLKNKGSCEIREQSTLELQMPTHEEATHYSDLALSDGSKGEGNYSDLCLKTSSNQESKLSIKRKIKGKSSKQQSLKNKESREIKEQLSAQKVAEEFELQKSTQEEATHDSDLALSDDSKGEESDDLRSQATNLQENNNSDGKETVDHLIENNPKGRERDEQHGYQVDDDNKENAAASDENRMHEKIPKQNGRKILAVQNGKKVVTQAQDKKSKESLISSSSVVKLQKPKATNPKPFRLRTDERGILKERRTEPVVPQRESLTSNAVKGKLQIKQRNDIQGIKIPRRQERSKPAAAVTPENIKHLDKKTTSSPRESKAMQRLEKFRKISTPLQKHSFKSQGLVSTKNELASFLIPGQKLDVILENSPEVIALKRARKTDDPSGDDATTSQPSSCLRRPVAKHAHVPRMTSCTKKLK